MRIPRPPKIHRSSVALLRCCRRHRPHMRPFTQLHKLCNHTRRRGEYNCEDCEPFPMQQWYDEYPVLLTKPKVHYFFQQRQHPPHLFSLFFRNERVMVGDVEDLKEGITMAVGFLANRLRLPTHEVKQMIIDDDAMRALARIGSSEIIDTNSGCCTGR